ncbi:variable surface protein [Plasmodium gonderi]|uniref:Variable surface protein n=1 Tax=Plasmodium gonderi TaxID=77519 RepID=A0A1Y1JNY9_PLAGO|nr:variable surface protein [Plasmodium gonderi]GAW84201.1 variable surface protein [Plasmodium gonderi]
MSSNGRKEHFNSLFTAFPEYQGIMDKNSTVHYEELWNKICLTFDKKFNTVNIKEKVNLCTQAMKYLYNILSDIHKVPDKNHFKYLYYWIYKNHLKAKKHSNYIKDFYKEIIRVYKVGGYFTYLVDSFLDVIFDKELEIITDICDMSNKLNDIKYNTFTFCENKSRCDCADECADIYMRGHNICENNGYKDFCEILESYKNEYNVLDISQSCDKIKCKALPCEIFENIIIPSAHINTSKTAIISSYLILIIPALLFIIYKFLPYNSCLHLGIKKIKNKCLDLKKEWSKSEISEIYKKIHWNNNYNVLYNSHYIEN